jgi:transcriptional regulator with XRE-family HTH domain
MKRPINADTLSPEQLADALAQLGWKQTDFAHRTGVTAATVSTWTTGKAPAPLWATAYLEAMLDLAMLHRKYLAPRPSPRPAPGADANPPAPAPARLAHLLPGGPPETE